MTWRSCEHILGEVDQLKSIIIFVMLNKLSASHNLFLLRLPRAGRVINPPGSEGNFQKFRCCCCCCCCLVWSQCDRQLSASGGTDSQLLCFDVSQAKSLHSSFENRLKPNTIYNQIMAGDCCRLSVETNIVTRL